MQVTYLCQQELPCFLLFSLFSTAPGPPSIMPSKLTALGELLTTCSPSVLALKAFLGRQLDCLDAQQNCLCAGRRLRAWWYRGVLARKAQFLSSIFPIFATGAFEMQPPHMQCFTPVSNYLTAPILSAHATACRRRRKQVICIQSKYFVITCCSS